MDDISSNELNYIVYRYLAESGFQHSAFLFLNESAINQAKIRVRDVPSFALLKIIKKGILYTQAEIAVGDGVDGPLDPLSLVEAVMDDVVEIHQQKARQKDKRKALYERDDKQLTSTVTLLTGYQPDVINCAWHPRSDVIVRGSSEYTFRMSDMNNLKRSVVMRHTRKRAKNMAPKGVTSLSWNLAGSRLATGLYDGSIKIWNADGRLTHVLRKHIGAVFAIEWHSTDAFLLSAGVDSATIIWNTETGKLVQLFTTHRMPTLDIAWLNDKSFATCSSDTTINVCKEGLDKPLRTFQEHRGEVNEILWCPRAELLASCSDDTTVKVWTLERDEHWRNLAAHTKPVMTIRWGPPSESATEIRRLASASIDSTVIIWNVNSGAPLKKLDLHEAAVYGLAFSPNGKQLATGAYDNWTLIWNVQDGKLITSYEGKYRIHDLKWNYLGNRLAAISTDGDCYVLDLKML